MSFIHWRAELHLLALSREVHGKYTMQTVFISLIARQNDMVFQAFIKVAFSSLGCVLHRLKFKHMQTKCENNGMTDKYNLL